MPHRKCNDCLKEFSCRQSLFVHKKKCQAQPSHDRNMGYVESVNNILTLAKHLKIPNFIVCNQVSGTPDNQECGIIILPHLVSYFKDGNKRIFFDSLGRKVPIEIEKYLKTEQEFQDNAPVIQRNTDFVTNTDNGHICLYVLDNLSKGVEFQDIINSLH